MNWGALSGGEINVGPRKHVKARPLNELGSAFRQTTRDTGDGRRAGSDRQPGSGPGVLAGIVI